MESKFNFGAMDDEDREEMPPMRAVAMGSSTMPSVLSFSSTPVFGKAPPMGISRPPSLGARNGHRAESFGIKNEWTGSTTWDVKVEDLERVPWEFRLERTHREIAEDATTIASRISEVLRKLSVETEFVGKPPKAKCTSGDSVSFRIRLFSGEDDQKTVIVEVQRRSGSASSFMRTCRAILDAAEGKTIEDASRAAAPRMAPKPIGAMQCLQGVPEKASDTSSEEAKEDLDRAIDMIRSKSKETTIMGLENLIALTDPFKTNPAVALRVSKSITLYLEEHDFRDEIQALMERDVFGDSEDVATKHSDHIRYLMLSVFANALNLCAEEGCLVNAVESQTWFVDFLIPTLTGELARADTCANNAYQAACCVHSLISCSKKARKSLVNDNGRSAVEKAYEFGKVRHELLADEAERCLQVLNSP